MRSDEYAWLLWSSAFLIPWCLLYIRFPADRRRMVRASVLTAPFGLTEPLFVPEYWNPPSLFGLAARTGFDLESLIFSWGIGGVGVVLYDVLTHRRPVPVDAPQRNHRRHRWHRWALGVPIALFPPLWFLSWNPIYPGIVSMAAGAVAASMCRPDLKRKTLVGGGVFLIYYLVFLVGLELTVPGYIERVWNLNALSGGRVAGLPLEELLFAAAFGAYWSGVYEHLTWRKPTLDIRGAPIAGASTT